MTLKNSMALEHLAKTSVFPGSGFRASRFKGYGSEGLKFKRVSESELLRAEVAEITTITLIPEP